MKKIFTAAASVFLVMIAAHAQEKEKPPPPPPPPPKIVKDEKLKRPPAETVIEERVKVQKVDGKTIKEPPVVTVTGKMADEFYNRNPSVSDISRKGNIITLKMKDGTIEKYDMSKKEEDKDFTEKYGSSPIPPPPPPKEVKIYKKVS